MTMTLWIMRPGRHSVAQDVFLTFALFVLTVHARNKTRFSNSCVGENGRLIPGFCKNGGSCLPGSRRGYVVPYRCVCIKGTTGSRCQTVLKGLEICTKKLNPCKHGGECYLKSMVNVSKASLKWTSADSPYWCDCTNARYKKSGRLEGEHCEKYVPFTGKCKDICKHGKCIVSKDKEIYTLTRFRDDKKLCACHFGYEGDWCQRKCEPGRYGLYCDELCSEGCEGTCHHKTGKCSPCVIEWLGARCDVQVKCIPDCSEKQTKTSPGVTCVHGKCTPLKKSSPREYCKCNLGYNGTNCTSACSEFGTYGKMCSGHCGHCAHGPCHKVNGLCPKVKGQPTCLNPYFGKKCQRSQEWEIDGIYKIQPKSAEQKKIAVASFNRLIESEVNEENKRRLAKALKIYYGKRTRVDVITREFLGAKYSTSPTSTLAPAPTDEVETGDQKELPEDTEEVVRAIRSQVRVKRQVAAGSSSDDISMTVEFSAYIPADQLDQEVDPGEQVAKAIRENADELESDLFPGFVLDSDSIVIKKVTLLGKVTDDEGGQISQETGGDSIFSSEVAVTLLAVGLGLFVIVIVCMLIMLRKLTQAQLTLGSVSSLSRVRREASSHTKA